MLAYFLFLVSKEDIKTRQIPDEYSLAIAILSIGSGGFSIWRFNLAILIIILTGLVMGLGDAKLFGALTLLFGIQIFTILFFSFLAAAIYCLFGLVKKDLKLCDTIAFAPFISCATLSIYTLYIYTQFR